MIAPLLAYGCRNPSRDDRPDASASAQVGDLGAATPEPNADAGPSRESAAETVGDGVRVDTLPSWASPREPGTASGQQSVRGRGFSFAFWDSSQIDLRLIAGRIEHKAEGRLPPAALPAVVAAFNGGFRAVHGGYGLRADGVTYLPARAGLASVARCEGRWWLGTSTPSTLWDGCSDIRQNLAPLLDHGQFNPLQRGSFGALAPGKEHGRTTRSALGLRPDGWFVYVYGIDVSAEELAAAAAHAGAAYAMALDINDGQAGFEWLALAPGAVVGKSASLRPPPVRAPTIRSYRGRLGGHEVRAERLQTPMGTPLPRWLLGDGRDHFVLLRISAEPQPVARLGPPPGEK